MTAIPAGPDDRVVGGRFRLEAQSKRGGLGTVHRATDLETGRIVAVKLLHRSSEDLTERFAREAEVLSGLEHPAIVRYVAHGTTDDGVQYLAMEWLEGESLAERLADGPLTVGETIALARRVADALALAHSRGLVHRDIKPGNVFLEGKSPHAAKLIDFGIARVESPGAELTTVGLAIGTVGYMAPEQARGERAVDARADVFSLGCVMFKCIAGHAPFSGSNLTAVLAKTLFEEAPRLGELSPDAPASLEALVARMLGKEPGLRPPDGAALVAELSHLAEMRPSALPREGPGLTGGEQQLVSVVLVGSAAIADEVSLERLRACASRFGARLDPLASGQVIVTLYGTRSATDQAGQAARCALAMHEVAPDAPIVLATGRGLLAARVPVGQAIERAVSRLEATTIARRRGPGVERLFALDDVTAGLLAARFLVVARDDGLYLEAERDPFDVARTLLGRPAPFVGRTRELGTLWAALEACEVERAAHIVLVTGAAGVGKSRLRFELLRKLSIQPDAWEVWIGRGDPMSRGSPLRMLSQALSHAMGIVDGEAVKGSRDKVRTRVLRHLPPGDAANRVTEFLGELLGVPFPDEESVQLRAARHDAVLRGDQIRRALSDFVSAECSAKPLLIVLEDLHWGDQPTVDAVEALVRTLADKPLLVVALGRPEVFEMFPALWARAAVTRLTVGELGERAAATLVRQILGDDVDDATVQRLIRRAEGNAFFLEELIRAIADGGAGDTLPETVVAVVHARLERLDADERRALRAASVFGAAFWQGGVKELVGDAVAPRLAAAFDALVARELLTRRQNARFKGEIEYVFRHDHVREAAYGMLTDRDRALGHRIAADWLERVGERDALVLAEHLERGRDVARASRWFLRAAEQALAANDLAAALARASRAEADADRDVLGDVRLLQAEVHAWRGEHGEVKVRGEEAMRALPRGSASWHEAAGQVAEACGRIGDDARLAALGEELLAIATTEAASGPSQAIAAVRAAAQLFWTGRFEMARALIAAVEPQHAALAEAEPAAAGWIDYGRSLRALFGGDLGENLRLKEAAVAAFVRAGDERNACIQRVRLGYASLLIGAHVAGEQVLRAALASAERMGLTKVSALARHNLGLALARVGGLDEARAVEGEALAAYEAQGDLRLAGASHLYLAWILTAAGDLATAEQHARAAVDMQRTRPPSLAEARATLARVLLRAGRAAEALEEARAASDLLDELGAVEDAEALIRLVFAEALFASGETSRAAEVIARAKSRLVERADKIADAELRRCFLEEEPDNRTTMELAQPT